MSYVDDIFKNNIERIIKEGISTEGHEVRPRWADTNEMAHTKSIFCVTNSYDLSKGIPLMTLRKTNWKKALDEILWIWQKKSNNVKDLNSKIWDQWADESGSIGKAYGYQLAEKFMYNGKMVDQVDCVLEQLRNHSVDRGIITNIYNHKDLADMRLRPCVHSTQWKINGNKLDMMLTQRSQDMLVANNWNVVQYAFLVHMFARDSNLEVGTLHHVVADMHMYDRHEEIVKELLKNETYDLPKLIINPDVKNFYDFKVSDFTVEGYKYSKDIKNLPVAV